MMKAAIAWLQSSIGYNGQLNLQLVMLIEIIVWQRLNWEHLRQCSVIGDNRWAGTYGVEADFIAKSHCSVEYITRDALM